jgi:uncharacterized protein (AIM24 family)
MTTPHPQGHPPAAAHHCRWCGAAVDPSTLSCPRCGAPVERSLRPTNSGWIEQPPIKDMARLRVGSSTCQIEGIYVPVADFNLAAGDGVYFAHHVLLWKDSQVRINRMPLQGAFTRALAGMPVIMTDAEGPGHIAFSRDEPGEVIALPLQHGQSVDVREHLLLAATRNVQYDWFNTGVWYATQRDNDVDYHYPMGQFMDRFTALDQPGLVLLHASGNVMVRELAAGQTMLIKPTALVYKDRSVRMGLNVQYPSGYWLTSHRVMWLHVVGPGRVAIQSAYEPVEDEGGAISSYSNLLGGYEVGTVRATAATIAPVRPQPQAPRAPIHIDPRHQLLVEKVKELMVNGQVPPNAMDALMHFAAEQGLAAYDVRLIIKHVQSHGT